MMNALDCLDKMCDNCERNKFARREACPFKEDGSHCVEYDTILKELKEHLLDIKFRTGDWNGGSSEI